jgi:hypothetical protein
VALAWLIAQPGITAPIASATNEQQLADLVEATKLKLDAESIQKLNVASTRKNVAEPVAQDRRRCAADGFLQEYIAEIIPQKNPRLCDSSILKSQQNPYKA